MPDRTWKIAVGIALGTILLYLSPYVILGEDSYVLIEDHLDSSVVILKTLAESGLIFDTSGKNIPNYFNGIPRSNFHSEFSFLVWLYALFGAFSAMVINEVLIRLIGFFGMLWLLRRYFLPDPTQAAAVVGASLSFALLPHWPCGGLSVAGQPLLLAALLSIRAGRYGWKEWAVVRLDAAVYGFRFLRSFLSWRRLVAVVSGSGPKENLESALSSGDRRFLLHSSGLSVPSDSDDVLWRRLRFPPDGNVFSHGWDA